MTLGSYSLREIFGKAILPSIYPTNRRSFPVPTVSLCVWMLDVQNEFCGGRCDGEKL